MGGGSLRSKKWKKYEKEGGDNDEEIVGVGRGPAGGGLELGELGSES